MIFYGAIDAAAAAGGDVWVGVIFVLGFATALIFALSLHEMSHALAAKINGDLTAAMYGRLSLNPMRHFDPVGLVMMLLSASAGRAQCPSTRGTSKITERACWTLRLREL